MPEVLTLNAGPLSMVFQPSDGFLRYLRLGDIEVLRGAYAAVRDRNWDTIAPEITLERCEIGDDAFDLTFAVRCRSGEVDFRWAGRLSGTPEGTVDFTFDGEALRDFQRNRIGFCVLHPPELAGRPCRVENPEGEVTEGCFPERISPHQPFFNIRAIAHPVAAGLSLEVRMEGEVFEMEDQRNWTDASYKTYCTPLERPFPVRLSAGDRISQRLRIRLLGAADAAPARATPRDSELRLDAAAGRPVPPIGFGWPAGRTEPLSDFESGLLAQLPVRHLRLDLRAGDPASAALAGNVRDSAERVGAGVEAVIFVEDGGETALTALRDALPRVDRWVLLDRAGAPLGAAFLERCRSLLGSGTPIGTGTNAYFTELNRNRPEAGAFDFVAFSINPQVHAFDDDSLVETLAMQTLVIENARMIAGGKGAVVTPVTLRPRFNPNATDPASAGAGAVLPESIDPRQMEPFGAVWTLGSLRAIAAGGAGAATYYEISGPRGLFDGETGSVYPLYHAFAVLRGFEAGESIPLHSSSPLELQGWLLRAPDRIRLLAWNYGTAPCEPAIRLDQALPRTWQLRSYNAAFLETGTPAEPEMRKSVRSDADGTLGVVIPPRGFVRLDAEPA